MEIPEFLILISSKRTKKEREDKERES